MGAIDPVERVDVYVLSAPIDPPAGASIGLASAHEYVLVRLMDTAGRTGWGETYYLPGGDAVLADLAAMLIGEFPTAMHRHRARFARTRASSYSRSALLIALDDLRSRQFGVPLHYLYGGPTRKTVVAYAASEGYVEGQELEHTWITEAQNAIEQGFSALKLRVGRFPISREGPALAQVRDLLGSDIDLMVDGNGGYTPSQAIRMGELLRDLNVRWFEEPLPQDGYRGYADLRRSLTVALAGGEVVESLDSAMAALDCGAYDIFQPEVVICGGIETALEMARIAEMRGCQTIPHTSGGAIGIAATIQLLAALNDPNESPATEPPLLEFGMATHAWRTGIFEAGLEAVDGEVPVPDKPGLGWEVDEGVVEQRAVRHLVVHS